MDVRVCYLRVNRILRSILTLGAIFVNNLKRISINFRQVAAAHIHFENLS